MTTKERDATKKALETQLEVIKAEEKAERDAEKKRFNDLCLKNIDFLLAFTPEHSFGYTCTDEKPNTDPHPSGCKRCMLLDVKKSAAWQGWPENLSLYLDITMRQE